MGDIERAREWFGPDMSDTAVHISLLETERDGMRLQVADLERQLEQWVRNSAVWQRRIQALERQLAEARAVLKRIARGAELQANVMRDPLRTGGWAGAEKVADAFDDIADRARGGQKSSVLEH